MRRSWILFGYTLALAVPSGVALAKSPQTTVQPCQPQSPTRSHHPQGTLLWGTTRLNEAQPKSAILVSAKLSDAKLVSGKGTPGLKLQEGKLVMPSFKPGDIVLQGKSSDDSPVEVAICSAKESSGETWYEIEVRQKDSGQWVNPCVPSGQVSSPRALAVPGVWDETGARQDSEGSFTFACQLGAIAKCSTWGYKPWDPKMADLHQACTRMARADYCGDGRSGTWNNNVIDMYDGMGHVKRETRETPDFSPSRASFEAAWTPEGAWCLARTRKNTPLEEITQQCPGRFEKSEKDLGDGDVCTLVRKVDANEQRLVHNRSYPPEMKATVSP